MSARIPTRWVAQMEGQVADAERRLASADRALEAGNGGRALEELYPGVMAAAMVKVWLADEPWHTRRSLQDLSRLVRDALPSGFASLFELQVDHRSFTGWRAEDARPYVEEARAFVGAVRADLQRCLSPSAS